MAITRRGEGFQVEHYKLRKSGVAVAVTRCCDCGLTHREEFKPIRGRIRIRVSRDEELTSKARKSKKYDRR